MKSTVRFLKTQPVVYVGQYHDPDEVFSNASITPDKTRIEAWDFTPQEITINGVFFDKDRWSEGNPSIAELKHGELATLLEPSVSLKQEIEAQKVEVTPKQVVDAMGTNAPSLKFLDRHYIALPETTWKRILTATETDNLLYVSEHFDCDNFAVCFTAEVNQLGVNGVGVVLDYGRGHAYNAVLVSDEDGLRVVTIEPQNDQWAILGGDLSSINGEIVRVRRWRTSRCRLASGRI